MIKMFIPTLALPSLKGTLAKPAMPTLKSNFAKEPFSPSRSNAGQGDRAAKINRLKNEQENGQLVTCGHTQYGGYSVFQRLWLVSTSKHFDTEVASKSRTAHTAVRYGQATDNLQNMSFSNKIPTSNPIQDKIILEIEKYDFHLIRLDKYIHDKIIQHNKERPDKINSEDKFYYGSFLDNEIYDLIITNDLLYNNALISYYSFFEHTIFEICKLLKSNLKLDLKVSDIRGDNYLNQCRKYIEKVAHIKFNKTLDSNWQMINDYRQIRNLIVHNLSNLYDNQEYKTIDKLSNKEKKSYKILNDSADINFNKNSGDFSVTIDYVSNYSKLILGFLLELTELITDKNVK